MTLYLLHFESPISPDHTCQHYLGYCDNGRGSLGARLLAHANGRGARLTQVARDRGIGWSLVRTWPGATRSDERHLKERNYGNRLCPVCSPAARRALVLPSGWSRKRLVKPRTRFVVPSHSPVCGFERDGSCGLSCRCWCHEIKKSA